MLSDKYYTPEQLQRLIEELQELVEEVIVYEYDYMTDDGKDALDRIAELLNLNIE
jgi:hypothetical protein